MEYGEVHQLGQVPVQIPTPGARVQLLSIFVPSGSIRR